MCERFKLYDKEIQFINELLEENPQNNSMWSYRYFIQIHINEFNSSFVEKEME